MQSRELARPGELVSMASSTRRDTYLHSVDTGEDIDAVGAEGRQHRHIDVIQRSCIHCQLRSGGHARYHPPRCTTPLVPSTPSNERSPNSRGRIISVTPCPAAYVTSSGTDAMTAQSSSASYRFITRTLLTWNGQLPPPSNVEYIVEEPQERRSQETEQAREVSRERVMREQH